MKINGKTISGLNIETIVLPRGDNDQLVFKAQAVLDYVSFEKLFPAPKPKKIVRPGGATQLLVDDPTFLKEMGIWSERRYQWLILKSLEATSGLEWETVKMDDPATWVNYQSELRDSGLTDIEVGRIITGVMTANALNEDKIEAAKQRFLASQLAVAAESTPTDAQQNI